LVLFDEETVWPSSTFTSNQLNRELGFDDQQKQTLEIKKLHNNGYPLSNWKKSGNLPLKMLTVSYLIC